MLSANELAEMRSQQNQALPDSTTITRPAFTNDGYGSASRTWGNVATVAARFSATSGNEDDSNGRVVAQRSWTVTVPFGTNIAVGDRVTGPGNLVLEVVQIDSRGSWTTATQVTAKETS